MKREEGMGRKDDGSIRNEARSGTSVGFPMTNAQRSMTGVASSISEECPLIPTVCLGDGQLGVLLGHARAFSRSERASAGSERGYARNARASAGNERGSGSSERGSGRGEGAS